MPDETPQAPQGVTLDMSKSTPLPQAAPAGVTLDMSKSQPIQNPDEVAARHARSAADARARGLRTDMPDQEDFMDKVRTGVGKEAVSTVSGLSNLANKVLPSSLQIPTEQHQIQTTVPPEQQPAALAAAKEVDTPHGGGETIGALGETMIEWLTGEAGAKLGLEGIKGIVGMAKTPEAVLALIDKYPKAAKLFTAAAKGAVGGGIQGAVKESATGGEGATKGAEAGALGGGIGGVVAEAVPMVAKPLGKAFGIGTSSEEDISKAAQFAKGNLNALKDWAKAQGPIAEAFDATGEPKSLAEGVEKIKKVRQDYWTKISGIADKHANEPFDATNVASEVRKLADNPALKRFPEDRQKLLDFANQYTAGSPNFTGEAKVGDAIKEIKKYNAKLDQAGYWNKPPEVRARMEEADPQIAAWRTASNELRESLFAHLKSVGEPNMEELRDTYGAIGNVERSLRGQINVAGRAKNVSLKKALGLSFGLAHGGVGGAAAIAAPILDAWYNDPVRVLNRAVSKAGEESASPITKALKAGTATLVKTGAPAGGGEFVRFLASDGSTHRANADQWPDKVKESDPGAKKIE